MAELPEVAISTDAKTTPRFRLRNLGIIAVTGVAVGAAALVWNARSPGPDEIASAAARALCVHDVDALLALTLPEELVRLHISRDSLSGFLNETVWSRRMPRTLNCKLRQDTYVDERLYTVAPADGVAGSPRFPLHMFVTQSPDYRWHLATSYLLFDSCNAMQPEASVPGTGTMFYRLASKYGITGLRLNSKGYDYVSKPTEAGNHE